MTRNALPARLLLLAVAAMFTVATCTGPGASPSPGGGPDGTAAGSPSGTAAGAPSETDSESPSATTEASPAESPGGTPADGSAEPAPSTPEVTPEPTPSVACGEGAGGGQLAIGAKSAAAGADEIATTRYQLYCDQNADVEVTFSNRDFDRTSFLIDVQAGTSPDVVRMDRALIGTYISAGALDPLDQCIADHGIDMTQYYEAAVRQVTSEDIIYGIPEFVDTRLVLINDSVVEEAGLTAEDVDTSDWEALASVNEQLMKKDGGLTRIGFDPKINDFLPLWARANGASVVSDDGLTAQLDDPKVAEALEFGSSLVLAHGSSAEFFDFRGTWDPTFFGPENPFAADQAGAFPMESFYLNVLASNSPEESVSFQPFRARDGSEITFASGSTWAIPSSAKNKDEACEFMKVITSPDAWIAASRARAEKRAADGQAYTGTYSGNHVADDTIFGEIVTTESAGRFYDGVQLVIRNMPNAFALPPIPCGDQFDVAWREAVRRVLEDGMPAADSLAQAQTEAQDAIDAGAAGQPCP